MSTQVHIQTPQNKPAESKIILPEQEYLEPVKEDNESTQSESLNSAPSVAIEIPPRILGVKDVTDEVNLESLQNVSYELGIIELCWPEICDPVIEGRTEFPASYCINTNKEKLLLAYAENFRRQFTMKYPKRRCLILQAPNECGIQKMLCTSIRPSKLCYKGTDTWEGCSLLVSDFCNYEPLARPMLPPERLNGPFTTLVRRLGNSFELATLLASLLIGNGYDAYVVIGYAPRETTLGIQNLTESPDLPDDVPELKTKFLPRFKPQPETKKEEREAGGEGEIGEYTEGLEETFIEGTNLQEREQEPPQEKEAKEDDENKEEELKNDTEEGKVKREEEEEMKEEEMKEEEAKDTRKIGPIEEALDEEVIEAELSAQGSLREGSESIKTEQSKLSDVEEKPSTTATESSEPKTVKEEVAEQKDEDVNMGAAEGDRDYLEEPSFEVDICANFFQSPAPDFTSRFLQRLKDTRSRKIREAEEKILEETRLAIEERNRPPPDPIEGWRVHAWILVKPSKDIMNPMFVEPSEGFHYNLDAPKYHSIDCVYDHRNYYVNMQDCSEGLDKISYDLFDLECWEHLLPGEPPEGRNLPGTDTSDPTTVVDTEKHLDITKSWVERLNISPEEFGRGYPGGYKIRKYKCATTEKFAKYYQRDGIIKRVTTYEDELYRFPLVTVETYSNRKDRMVRIVVDHPNMIVREEFEKGRNDMLKAHTYRLDAPQLLMQTHRTFDFYYYPRCDHLIKVVTALNSFEESFVDRQDKLLSRKVLYESVRHAIAVKEEKEVIRIIEEFARNPDIPAKEDTARRTYDLRTNEIDYVYHFERNYITNYTRSFDKPDLTMTAGVLLWDETKTKGYVANVLDQGPTQLSLYRVLKSALTIETESRKKIRDRESDIRDILDLRYRELVDPELVVDLFDTDRNFQAHEEWRQLVIERAAMEKRELDFSYDSLAPYLAMIFGKDPVGSLTAQQAVGLKRTCLEDFKARQLAIQQRAYDQYNEAHTQYKQLKLWYLAHQYVLNQEKEAKYFEESGELSFKAHALETRMTRFMDLSHGRYAELVRILAKHPALLNVKTGSLAIAANI